MHWKTIRLELASTPDFPGGSAGRAYLLRLPIDDSGRLDAAALNAHPEDATVRRFWPSEPDRAGHIERTPLGWELRWTGERGAKVLSRIEEQRFQLGGQVFVTEDDGHRLPFRVTDLTRLA